MKKIADYSGKQKEALMKAVEMKANAYNPYSHFPVGCAIICANAAGEEKMFIGSNVENASYGLTICAERNAIGNAISNMYRQIKFIAIATDSQKTSPCGACLQFICEFCDDVEIMLTDEDGNVHEASLNKCLPLAFRPQMLHEYTEKQQHAH